MTSTTFNSPSDARTDAATAALAPNWWLFLLRGILGVIFGCLALIFPGPTMLSLVLLFSAYMLVDGVAGIISAVRAMRRGDRWGTADPRRAVECSCGHRGVPLAGPYRACLRAAGCRMGHHYRGPDDSRGFPPEPRTWPLVAGPRRSAVAGVWCATYIGALDRRPRPDLVDGRICHRLWRRTGHILIPTPIAAAGRS